MGFDLVGKNLRVGRGELDLVFKKTGTIVFVEVKTRIGSSARLFDSLSHQQELTIEKAGIRYLKQNRAWKGFRQLSSQNHSPTPHRFDRIGIVLDPRSLAAVEILHFTDHSSE